MAKRPLQRAVYPGTFDPVTNGHIDLIKRAMALFDEVVIGVAVHSGKDALFSVDERVDFVKRATRQWRAVKVLSFDGLVVDFARRHKACVIIRGLRMLTDFEYEFQMALTNRALDPGMETVFMMPSAEYSYLSSRLIKQAAALGADVNKFVPPFVARDLHQRARGGKRILALGSLFNEA
ncbi:MAG: pantetheine-phosphate adenylyltransferase [Candidatus Omnitrophica bacterium]|nr:pantetheine-phosphate adenylyltransferase [Candidatus Omnitrophota bacterium]